MDYGTKNKDKGLPRTTTVPHRTLTEPSPKFGTMSRRNETVTNCHQLKMTAADGKQRLSDVADTEQILRLIQSVPSKKAESIKMWLAKVGQERLTQMQDPERSIDQAIADYRRLGYSESWINQRIKTIEVRKGLTDEWQRGGIQDEGQYAFLTDLMSKVWSGFSTKEYKHHKVVPLRAEISRHYVTVGKDATLKNVYKQQ